MTTATTRLMMDKGHPRFFRQRFLLQVVEGPDRGCSLRSAKQSVTVGSAQQNDLVLTDIAVSRHHLRIEVLPQSFLITDLESTNGTTVESLGVRQVVVGQPVDLRLGETLLRFVPLGEEEEVPILDDDHFGPVLGRSASMRELFKQLEQLSKQQVTLVLEGETGTGKELIARAVHERSPRRNGPFVTVDCGAIPPSLLESELFGHVHGAFTGAERDRAGAFETAQGGTIFLDEIGELDMPSQPRLLRVLERREIKRLGETRFRRVDVRVIAATNRDLQRCVNQGTFRSDLYFRLAVARIYVPPLRQRPEDIELLIERMLPEISARLGAPAPKLDSETLRQAAAHPWPGNVRELRNFLERLVTLSSATVTLDPVAEIEAVAEPGRESLGVDDLLEVPFREAKAIWLAHFDLEYIKRLLARCSNNVAEAARRSGIDRVHLFRLIKKYKLRK